MKYLLVTLLFFSTCTPAKGQGTYYAASPSINDVDDCVNSGRYTGGPHNTCHSRSPTGTQASHTAVNGDTINVPAGSATWGTELQMTSGQCFALIGNGTPNNSANQFGAGTVNTIITLSVANSFQIAMNPDAATCRNNVMRLSTFKFLRGSTGSSPAAPIYVNGYVCTSSDCPHVRIDNIIADSNWCTSPAPPADTFIVAWNFFGVVDHNTIGGSSPTCPNIGISFVNVGHGWYLNGVNSSKYGDNSYAQPGSFGTARAVYLENNSLIGQAFLTDTDYPSPYQSGTLGAWSGGGRYVVRFNNMTFGGSTAFAGNHGTESTGRTRGARQMEYYNNVFTCANTGGCNAFGARSGTWLTFDNTLNAGTGFWGNVMTIDDYRSYVNFNPWGGCFGSTTNGPFDTNDRTTYYTGTVSATSQTSLTDNSQTWTATFGSSSWWSSAAHAGSPYSIYDTTQGFGAEIAFVSGNVITFKQNPICNWGTGAACTINTNDAYVILRATVCLDQPGRGPGNLIKDSSPGSGIPVQSSGRIAGPVSETLDPGYEWGDSTPATMTGAIVSSPSTNRMIVNRDWYNENQNQTAQTNQTSPFNGTAGVGHGTLHSPNNRPPTCTAGTAYWATDEGNWNTTVAANTSGDLYICGASGWPASPSYTPYTYPHPLIAPGLPQASVP